MIKYDYSTENYVAYTLSKRKRSLCDQLRSGISPPTVETRRYFSLGFEVKRLSWLFKNEIFKSSSYLVSWQGLLPAVLEHHTMFLGRSTCPVVIDFFGALLGHLVHVGWQVGIESSFLILETVVNGPCGVIVLSAAVSKVKNELSLSRFCWFCSP